MVELLRQLFATLDGENLEGAHGRVKRTLIEALKAHEVFQKFIEATIEDHFPALCVLLSERSKLVESLMSGIDNVVGAWAFIFVIIVILVTVVIAVVITVVVTIVIAVVITLVVTVLITLVTVQDLMDLIEESVVFIFVDVGVVKVVSGGFLDVLVDVLQVAELFHQLRLDFITLLRKVLDLLENLFMETFRSFGDSDVSDHMCERGESVVGLFDHEDSSHLMGPFEAINNDVAWVDFFVVSVCESLKYDLADH